MIYNIDFDIVGLIFLIVVMFVLVVRYRAKTKSNMLFRLLVVSLMLTTALDIISAVTSSYPSNIPLFIHYLDNSLYFLLAAITPMFCLLYICEISKFRLTRIHMSALAVLVGTYILLLITNPFTRFLFYFDKGNVYTLGELYLLNYIVPVIVLLFVLSLLIRKRKMFDTWQMISNYSFIVCELIATAIQMIWMSNVLLTAFGGAVSIFIMLFSLETPDFIELEYLKNNLELEVNKKTKQIQDMSYETISALAKTIDAKDEYTKGHSARVAEYARVLGKRIGYTQEQAEELYNAAILHDIGKISIPDQVLNKASKLTDSEYKIIKSHSENGGDILKSVNNIPDAENIARHHHERYDGKGYPDGLKGNEIDMNCRILAIVDSFDAMNSNRVYRPRLPKDVIRMEFIKNKGLQFDPMLVDSFLDLLDKGELDYIENLD